MTHQLKELLNNLDFQRKQIVENIDKLLELNSKFAFDYSLRVVIARELCEPTKDDIWVLCPGETYIRNYFSDTYFYFGDNDEGDFQSYSANELPDYAFFELAQEIIDYPQKLKNKIEDTMEENQKLLNKFETLFNVS